jgi:hypothetical protein
VILVDSSVWIDYFRGTATPQADKLESLLGAEPIATGDLILTEVLQGFVSDREFNRAKKLLTSLVVIDLAGQEIAILAAKNFRALRAIGVSVRKTIDTVIATRCIESGLTLLYSDRDFDPFVGHLGLRSVLAGARDRLPKLFAGILLQMVERTAKSVGRIVSSIRLQRFYRPAVLGIRILNDFQHGFACASLCSIGQLPGRFNQAAVFVGIRTPGKHQGWHFDLCDKVVCICNVVGCRIRNYNR